MKKFMACLFLWVLFGLGAAAAQEAEFLGQPFPDFSALDTEGNIFTLSGALMDHEAVLINLWATWCPPCRAEFPYLNEAFEEYRDRVAFIALSCEEADTSEKIAAFREEYGIRFPMGRDEQSELFRYISGSAIPDTVIVDRFGNAAFFRRGSFSNAGEIERVLEAFLGDGYTKTTVLDEIPRDSSTRVFPVSAARGLYVENENVKKVAFRAAYATEPLVAYVINDDPALLRLEIGPDDNPASMVYYNARLGRIYELPTLLDTERNRFFFEQSMPGSAEEDHYTYGCLADMDKPEDPDLIEFYLITGDEYIEEFADLLRASGNEGITWEYEDMVRTENLPLQAYLLHIIDQYGEPVPGMTVNFCTDTACTVLMSDDNGNLAFDGEPDVYHVQLIKAPEGYSFDSDFEMYTDRIYGEWKLRVRKN